MIHALVAGALNTPELELQQYEAAQLSQAAANVAQHYEILGGASPELQAWMGLLTCAGFVYGPRAFALYSKRKAVAA